MLILAMLLQTVPFDPDAPKPLLRLLDDDGQACALEEGCEGDRRYRLEARRWDGDSTMARAMQGVWTPCETTGAPVCPSKPRRVLTVELRQD